MKWICKIYATMGIYGVTDYSNNKDFRDLRLLPLRLALFIEAFGCKPYAEGILMNPCVSVRPQTPDKASRNADKTFGKYFI